MSRSYLLVVIQFTTLAFLAVYGGVFGGFLSNSVLGLAFLIGLWAVITMRFRFNILPDVLPNQLLRTNGPYALVRHPMYTAVLLAGLAWVGNRPDMFSMIAWLILLFDLRVKMDYEERDLETRFSDFPEYATRTRRLAPWLY